MTPDSDHQILYACVCSGTTILSDFSSGDTDLKTLALKCIERTPPFHLLYSYTAGKRIYCFVIEDPFVFFAIIDEGFGKDQGFAFLDRLKTSFASFWKRQSIKSTDQLNSLCFQEEFGPVFRSLMHLSGEADQITKRNPDPIERDNAGAIPSPLLLDKQISNGGGEIGDVSVENVSDTTVSSNEIREGSLLPEKDGGSGVVDGGWRQGRRIWKKQPAFWYLGAVAVTCILLLICNSLDFSYSFPSAGRCYYQQCKIGKNSLH